MTYTCQKCGAPLPADMTKECPACFPAEPGTQWFSGGWLFYDLGNGLSYCSSAVVINCKFFDCDSRRRPRPFHACRPSGRSPNRRRLIPADRPVVIEDRPAGQPGVGGRLLGDVAIRIRIASPRLLGCTAAAGLAAWV